MSASLLLAPAGVGLTQLVTLLNEEPSSGVPRTLEVFYVEHELLKEVNWTSAKFPFVSEHKNMRGLLGGVTRRELKGMWQEALGRCAQLAAQSSAAHTVIAFHPTLFAARRSEQYSTVGWAIASGVVDHPDRVVLLIDDIFDMWERLGAEPKDLLHHAEWLRRRLEAQDLLGLVASAAGDVKPIAGKEATFDGLVIDSAHAILSRLLSWRHLDMVEAESLASALGAPLTTLGVKHPRAALERLVSKPETATAYLSHPISRPRRARTAGQPWPEVVGISNDLSARFADADIVLVCPTAIDEFRLVKSSEAADIYARPFALTERWPMLVPLNDAISSSHAPSDRVTHVDLLAKGSAPAVGAVARSLETEIYAEVPFRDHYLVTHTQGFFVFRPAYEEGKFSGGVRAEIDHWRQLSQFEPDRRAMFVHTREDVNLTIEVAERARPDRVRSIVRQFLIARGVGEDAIDEVLDGEAIKAQMLDADSPSPEVTARLLESALDYAGLALLFNSLTTLPVEHLKDEKVSVHMIEGSSPSRSDIESYSRFLRRLDPSGGPDAYRGVIEQMLGRPIAEWTRDRFFASG